MNKDEELNSLVTWAEELARSAGMIMREYFYSGRQRVEIKPDNTPVTIADKQINDLVISRVSQDFPEHGVLGEEASVHTERKSLWVCDPIDGTRGFILGLPIAMFSLAYVVDGLPMVAVMYEPLLDRMLTARRGGGAYENGSPIHVSGHDTLRGARIAFSPRPEAILGRHRSLVESMLAMGVQAVPITGEVFRGALNAIGKIDGHIFPGQGAHDVAAVKLIVEEAGGRVTDLYGNDQRYDRQVYGAIVSNGHCHDQLVKLMGEFGPENYIGYL
jgi:fructose-1,6-bisphosphatase/inositol monophosphatase family enzyme